MKDKMMRLLFLAFALIVNPNAAFSQYENNSKVVSVTVRYKDANPKDTLRLFVMNPLYPDYPNLSHPGTKIMATMDREGLYKFNLRTDRNIGYYMIAAELNTEEGFYSKERTKKRAKYIKQALTPLLIYESGDSIFMHISKKTNPPSYETFDPVDLFNISYSGPGSEKLKVWTQTHDIYKETGMSSVSFDADQKYVDGYAKCAEAIRGYIENHKAKMSPAAYELVMADALYSLYTSHLKNEVLKYYKNAKDRLSAKELENIKRAYFTNIKDALPGVNVSTESLTRSYYYFRYLIRKNIIDSYFLYGKEDSSLVFERMVSNYSGELRERMLTLFLYTSFGTLQFDDQLERAIEIVRKDYCRDMLVELEKRKSGREIGNFTLEDPVGNPVPLSKFKGKIIVMDFWFTGCGACKWTFENVLEKAEEAYRNNPEVTFLSISVDGSRRTWESSIKKEQYTSDKAVNLFTKGKGANHPITSYYEIKGYPTIILFNKEGKIDSYNLSEFTKPDGFKALSNQIDKLLTVAP